jgi:UDP:flavonoid glycosyltransferase YjiC (YdhE family)
LSKRVLFCWENGEGSGHVVPYLSLLESLKARGWETAVAARNTAEVGARVQASGAELMQAPLCVSLFPDLDSQSFSTTELLLQQGYGHEPTLNGIVSAWLGMMRSWQPDLVIGSGAPGAHLVAQCLGIPDIAIGSGFNCWVAAAPAPLMRAWQQGIEQRISQSEDRALQTINAVMTKHGFAKRKFAMDMYESVPRLLCTVAELDHFGDFRGESDYLGMLPSASSSVQVMTNSIALPPGEHAPSRGIDVFVYLRHTASSEVLIADLTKSGLKTMVYMPGLSAMQRMQAQAKHGSAVSFADAAVDIPQILAQVRLVVSNAGHNLTLQTLLAGKPMLLLPAHWEQGVVAQRAAKLGAAIEVAPGAQHPKFKRCIETLTQDASYQHSAQQFAHKYSSINSRASLAKSIELCERRARHAVSRPHTREQFRAVR